MLVEDGLEDTSAHDHTSLLTAERARNVERLEAYSSTGKSLATGGVKNALNHVGRFRSRCSRTYATL